MENKKLDNKAKIIDILLIVKCLNCDCLARINRSRKTLKCHDCKIKLIIPDYKTVFFETEKQIAELKREIHSLNFTVENLRAKLKQQESGKEKIELRVYTPNEPTEWR